MVVGLALLRQINNVLVTCKPPHCSSSELWRLNESACELEENENGCSSVAEPESTVGQYADHMLSSYNQ